MLNDLQWIFCILGDPGADSGGEGKSKRAGKNSAKRRPVPNSRGRSDFWLVLENFFVFLPNQRAADLMESFRLFLHAK